jgi:hypothetical protein
MMRSIEPMPELDGFLLRPGWQAHSACRGQDIRGFFPEGTALSLETRPHVCELLGLCGMPELCSREPIVEGSVGWDL